METGQDHTVIRHRIQHLIPKSSLSTPSLQAATALVHLISVYSNLPTYHSQPPGHTSWDQMLQTE